MSKEVNKKPRKNAAVKKPSPYKKNQTFGRPRKYDRDEMGEKMLEWVKDDNATTLLQFCVQEQIPAEYIIEWSKEKDHNFPKALKIVKATLGVRRENLVSKGTLYHGAWQRNAGVYDGFLKSHEREEKELDIELKNTIDRLKQVAPNDDKLDAIIRYLKK